MLAFYRHWNWCNPSTTILYWHSGYDTIHLSMACVLWTKTKKYAISNLLLGNLSPSTDCCWLLEHNSIGNDFQCFSIKRESFDVCLNILWQSVNFFLGARTYRVNFNQTGLLKRGQMLCIFWKVSRIFSFSIGKIVMRHINVLLALGEGAYPIFEKYFDSNLKYSWNVSKLLGKLQEIFYFNFT